MERLYFGDSDAAVPVRCGYRVESPRVVQEGSAEDEPSCVVLSGYVPQVVLPIVSVGLH